MNILVATDGALDPDRAADAVARWYVDGDKVTVFTVLSVPTEFLRGLDSSGVTGAAQIAQEAGQTLGAGDRAAERLIRTMPAKDTTKRDSPVLHALANTASERTQPIVEALKARGIEANSNWRSTESKTARTILAKVKDFGADLVIIGSHGTGRYEGQLGATVTKLVRLAPATVLVIRKPTETKD